MLFSASKGENFDIKSANQDKYQPMLCVFDILLLNDEVLSNKPLRQRKEILKKVFEHTEGTIIISETTEGRSKWVEKIAGYSTVNNISM